MTKDTLLMQYQSECLSALKSIANIHNAYMLERFICVFGINPDPQVIDKLFKELILFTARAA